MIQKLCCIKLKQVLNRFKNTYTYFLSNNFIQKRFSSRIISDNTVVVFAMSKNVKMKHLKKMYVFNII